MTAAERILIGSLIATSQAVAWLWIAGIMW